MKIAHNCDLTGYNSYRIPARCRIAYFPESAEDVAGLFAALREYVIIGSGHNIILANESYETPFIIFNGNFSRISLHGERMHLEAGAFTADACELALAHHLSGLELFYDIPSSLGGAIAMNAGYPEEDIAGLTESIWYWDIPAAKCMTIAAAQAGFSYRNSIFQNDPTKIVLAATLCLRPGNPAEIRARMLQIKAERWARQPREFPNAGSVFKRPAGRYVGPMLDELGLKGFSCGGFRVSPKHSGFIEKTGAGTGRQLLDLITDIQLRVRQHFSIDLEPEQRIISAP
jgi:UDP-N-acetylmuramate dehydrogenase